MNTKQQPTNKLPPHLLALVKKIEAKEKQFGIVDLYKIDASKFDDFHPIHALLR